MSKEKNARAGFFPLHALLLAAITLAAVLLRVPTMRMGLWLDEFISIYLATRPTLQATYELLWRGMEFNPPLNHLLMRAYISCFGTNEIIVRLPSLFWGILLVPAVYWLGATIQSRKAGMLAALFAAFSTQGNYFSCQARPYSISTLLNCLCIIYFCHLLDAKRQNKKLDMLLFVVLMTLFCYASTFGVFSLAVFVVAYAVLWLQKRTTGESETTTSLNLSLKQFAPAFMVPALMILPWLPTMLHQAKIIKPVDPCSLGELPWSFGVCLTTMLPTPLLLSIYLAIGATIWASVWLIYLAIKKKLPEKISSYRELLARKPPYVVLLVMTLLPSSIMGLFAGVWLGYFRYIYPFSPAEWMLLSLAIVGSDIKNDPPANKKRFWRRMLCGLVLILFCVVNLAYTVWCGQKSQSGLKLVAQAIREGKFDNSVILLAPDLPGPTLYYYSKETERASHNVDIIGFVREHPDTPTIGDVMSEQWSSKIVVDEYVTKVENLSAKGYKYLAFAQDSIIYGTPQIPLKPRVYALFDRLKSKYQIVRTETYPGLTETMNVSFFKLK